MKATREPPRKDDCESESLCSRVKLLGVPCQECASSSTGPSPLVEVTEVSYSRDPRGSPHFGFSGKYS